jgi:hypothetical protein
MESTRISGSGVAAYDLLSLAAQQSSANIPSSPESHLNRTPIRRRLTRSPIRRLSSKVDGGDTMESEQSSDGDANLVVVENPDGSLVEGIPVGFKHLTPVPSPPRSPRILNFTTTGLDLVELFRRHEKVFLALMLLTVFVDTILLTEEFAVILSNLVNNPSAVVEFSRSVGSSSAYLGSDTVSKVSLTGDQARRTFTVFPPTWPLSSALVVSMLDLCACLLFFVSGFIAYVSKQRRAYAWFSSCACGTLIWQVILSCVDKLSLVLFLFRLACFTHSRFMGDLMDDIALLATLMGARPANQTEDEPVRGTSDNNYNYGSTS